MKRSLTFALYSNKTVSLSCCCNIKAPLCTPSGRCTNCAIDGLMSAKYLSTACLPAQSRSSMITDTILPSTYFAAKLRKRRSPWTNWTSQTPPSPELLNKHVFGLALDHDHHMRMQGGCWWTCRLGHVRWVNIAKCSVQQPIWICVGAVSTGQWRTNHLQSWMGRLTEGMGHVHDSTFPEWLAIHNLLPTELRSGCSRFASLRL